MRKLIALFAVAAATVTAAGLGAAPSRAEAATRCTWQVPDLVTVYQSNGAVFTIRNHDAVVGDNGAEIDYFDVSGSYVEFVINWSNGSSGVYSGWIDSSGYVSGKTRDHWHPGSRAGWHFGRRARCVR